jgi:hypothetical protein
MTTKTWRIIGLVLMGLGVASYGVDWYVKGSLSGMGYTGFALMLIGFVFNGGALVSGK